MSMIVLDTDLFLDGYESESSSGSSYEKVSTSDLDEFDDDCASNLSTKTAIDADEEDGMSVKTGAELDDGLSAGMGVDEDEEDRMSVKTAVGADDEDRLSVRTAVEEGEGERVSVAAGVELGGVSVKTGCGVGENGRVSVKTAVGLDQDAVKTGSKAPNKTPALLVNEVGKPELRRRQRVIAKRARPQQPEVRRRRAGLTVTIPEDIACIVRSSYFPFLAYSALAYLLFSAYFTGEYLVNQISSRRPSPCDMVFQNLTESLRNGEVKNELPIYQDDYDWDLCEALHTKAHVTRPTRVLGGNQPYCRLLGNFYDLLEELGVWAFRTPAPPGAHPQPLAVVTFVSKPQVRTYFVHHCDVYQVMDPVYAAHAYLVASRTHRNGFYRVELPAGALKASELHARLVEEHGKRAPDMDMLGQMQLLMDAEKAKEAENAEKEKIEKAEKVEKVREAETVEEEAHAEEDRHDWTGSGQSAAERQVEKQAVCLPGKLRGRKFCLVWDTDLAKRRIRNIVGKVKTAHNKIKSIFGL